MAQEPPAWLDETFLASILQGEDERQVTIIKFSASPAVAAGNNYTSHMFRVRVEYTVLGSDLQITSLIIKIPISKGVITEVFDSSEFYAKEPKIYKELLPKLNKLVSCEFAPKFFSCPIKNGMILKDMKEEGYIMCDRFKRLDFSHCKLVYTTLAKFHASSIACYHNHSELINELGKNIMFSTKNEMYEPLIISSMKQLRKFLTEMEGCENIMDMISNRIDHMIESIEVITQPKMNGINVLNHGDLWINNMLFKHLDSGEVENIKFIDFQISRWGSPAPDLLYFMWTSADEEVRELRQRELYSLYLQTFNTSLEQLGCPERLSEQELNDDLRAAFDFALFVIGGTVPFLMCEGDEVLNMEDLSAEDFKTGDVFEHLYSSKRFKATFPKIVKQFQEWIAN